MKSFVQHMSEVQDVWGCRVPDLALIFLTDRDMRFKHGNDSVWGEGNWVRCDQGCIDGMGYPAYHHKDYHRELFHSDGPFEQALRTPSETNSRFPKDTELVIARASDPGGEMWRCWHVARHFKDGSIKGVCGSWIAHKGKSMYERQGFEHKDPKDFDPKLHYGNTCGRRGCIEQFDKLGLHYNPHVV